MQKLADNKARSEALNIKKSFIVQAPAGSGKTGLLVQRMLALLASSKSYPEECLAITFTKKAANEMRQRVLSALRMAIEPTVKTNDPYQQQTVDIAKKVIKRDRELGWGLLENPARIKVQTIDALCANIISKFPVTIKYGVAPSILEDATKIYQEAVTNFITDYCEDEDFIKISQRYDYDVNVISSMLTKLLSYREQWLPILYTADDSSSVDIIVTNELSNVFDAVVNDTSIQELPRLTYFAASSLGLDVSDKFCADGLYTWPDPDSIDLDAWKFISGLLLTSSGQVRKTVNKNQGFIKPEAKEDNELFKNNKAEMVEMLNIIKEKPKLVYYLNKVLFLPETESSKEQEELSLSVKRILPSLVAYLQLVFKKYGAIDFTEMMLSAIVALGDEDCPSDISLELDAKLSHILVDEFQDTSKSQIRLLELLTSGWENNDGRTLFLVGDPMQSIYKFRQADVGMYLRIRDTGIGDLKLNSVNLTSNFRSAPSLVNWVNTNMKGCFPSYDDVSTSKVKFTGAVPQKVEKKEGINPVVNASMFHDLQSESNYIANKIVEYKGLYPEAVIAILVRSRTQLPYIIHAMQAKSISYIGINIESLFNRPWIQEFLILFRSINHWFDDVAWFSLLRCSLCGVKLDDLTTIAGWRSDECIWKLIQSKELLDVLSEDGKKRVLRLIHIISKHFSYQSEEPFGDWLYSLWYDLGGVSTLSADYQFQDVQLVFSLLQQSEDNNNIFDVDYLESKISAMFADQVSSQSTNPVNIMTIHKSKGLEFDIVFLPGMNYLGKGEDKFIISWHQDKVGEQYKSLFHVNTSIERGAESQILQYLDYLRIEKKKNEDLRLLYVALTRSKSIIEIMGAIVEKKPRDGTFQSMLWPYFENEATFYEEVSDKHAQVEEKKVLYSLTSARVESDLEKFNNYNVDGLEVISKGDLFQESSWYTDLGILIHSFLSIIANRSDGVEYWSSLIYTDYFKEYCSKIFINKGYTHKESERGLESILNSLSNMLNDDVGKWILCSTHLWSASEWQLSRKLASSTEVETGVVDRIILDGEVCWVIDYKVCSSDDLDKEVVKYRAQLSRYMRLAKSSVRAKKYKCALYFPLQSKLKEVFIHEESSCVA